MNTKGLKVVSISALLAACLGSLHAESGSKSGAFIGAEVGYGINFERADPIPTNAQQQQTTTTKATAQYPYAALGLKVGYGHYFSQKFGLRGYASYHYGVNGSNSISTEIEQGGGSGGSTTTITKTNAIQSAHQVSANVEVVWDFLQLSQASFGVYAGVGVGYGTLTSSSTDTQGAQATITEQNLGSGLILPVNVGLEVGIGQHHRAGLNFRIPTIAASFKDNLGVNATYTEFSSRNLITSVGYSYVF